MSDRAEQVKQMMEFRARNCGRPIDFLMARIKRECALLDEEEVKECEEWIEAFKAKRGRRFERARDTSHRLDEMMSHMGRGESVQDAIRRFPPNLQEWVIARTREDLRPEFRKLIE